MKNLIISPMFPQLCYIMYHNIWNATYHFRPKLRGEKSTESTDSENRFRTLSPGLSYLHGEITLWGVNSFHSMVSLHSLSFSLLFFSHSFLLFLKFEIHSIISYRLELINPLPLCLKCWVVLVCTTNSCFLLENIFFFVCF